LVSELKEATMIGFGDFEVKLEQHRDHLRRAEKNRLVVQVTGNRKSKLGQMVSKLMPGKVRQYAGRDSLEVNPSLGFVEELI
jgi:translation initiation factor IF-3